jgi:hypothetical protein
MLTEPAVARDCVTPLLETLRPDWELCAQAAEIEQRLYRLAAKTSPPRVERWHTLIAQLAEPRFVRREAADRDLRSEGPALAPFLKQLDRRWLDAEQRSRLKRIEESLESRGEDTPARVAAQLVYDQTTWLALLTREDGAQRTAAARHLCKLCPEAVAFDPQADQKVRSVQLKQLRQQLAHD